MPHKQTVTDEERRLLQLAQRVAEARDAFERARALHIEHLLGRHADGSTEESASAARDAAWSAWEGLRDDLAREAQALYGEEVMPAK